MFFLHWFSFILFEKIFPIPHPIWHPTTDRINKQNGSQAAFILKNSIYRHFLLSIVVFQTKKRKNGRFAFAQSLPLGKHKRVLQVCQPLCQIGRSFVAFCCHIRWLGFLGQRGGNFFFSFHGKIFFEANPCRSPWIFEHQEKKWGKWRREERRMILFFQSHPKYSQWFHGWTTKSNDDALFFKKNARF